MPGYVFLDGVPIDDGAPYSVGWDVTDFGGAVGYEPKIQPTSGGVYTVNPLATAYGARKGRLTVYATALDALDKFRVQSTLKGLLNGSHTLHLAGRQLPMFLFGAKETSDDSRKSATLTAVTADFVSPQPFWSLNQPLKALNSPSGPVNVGEQWKLWADNTLPTVLPAYTFNTATIALNIWGSAYSLAAGTITGGPASTTVYLNNGLSGSARLAVALDASGNGTFAATGLLALFPGTANVTVELLSGTLITPGALFSITFGDTYMRFM